MGMEWLPHIWRKYEELAAKVVQAMRDLGEEEKQSGIDMLRNPWEEYAIQVQGEHSFLFELHVLTIRQIAAQILEALTFQDTVILWAATERALMSDDVVLSRSGMEEDVLDRLYSEVSSLGEKEDMSHYYIWLQAQQMEEWEQDEDDEVIPEPILTSAIGAPENPHVDQAAGQPRLFE